MLVDLGLDVYQAEFESPFLEASSEFYRREAQQYIATCDCADYLRIAERRLGEETERVAHYLDGRTEVKATSVVEREMIGSHMRLLVEMENSGLVPMLVNDKYEVREGMQGIVGMSWMEGRRGEGRSGWEVHGSARTQAHHLLFV